MSENTTTIQVSKQVWERLIGIKEQNGHTSMDSVVRSLLSTPCKGTKCTWYWNCVKYGCKMFKEVADSERGAET